MILTLPKLPGRLLEYIIDDIHKYINTYIDYKKLRRIEEYINGFMIKSPRRYTMRDIVTIMLYNIIYTQYSDKSVIQINPNVFLYGTNVKLIDIAKFITYGNLTVRGDSILADAFTVANNKLQQYINLYNNGGV